MALKLITAPAVEPILLAEAKNHLRVESDITADDTLIETLIKTARHTVETITRRALISQTWELVLDAFPGEDEIALPFPPLTSVTSITYKDDDGTTTTTWAASNYIVDADSDPGRIHLADGISWPSDTLYPVNAVRIRFVAGYGASGSYVPEPIRQAMLLLIGHYYENREASLAGGVQLLPEGVTALLQTYRHWSF